MAYCRAAGMPGPPQGRNEAPATIVVEVAFDCIHRGEKGPPLKCDCGGRAGGAERWIDTYRCNSPDQPRRACIIAGQIRIEPEASLYAVCGACRWREPPLAP